MTIREEVEKAIPTVGPITKTLYSQLLQFDGAEAVARELGYAVHFDRSIKVTLYRKGVVPYETIDEFQIIPRTSRWLEDGFIEKPEGLLLRLPTQEESDVIEALADATRNEPEIRLGVYYRRIELNLDTVTWHGEVTSAQELIDLLRDPPKADS